MDSGTSEAEF